MPENRFAKFTQVERDVMHDGLMGEARINPHEDPSFPPIVAAAEALLDELDAASATADVR